ncbi:MAG: hypothetical protein C0602_12825 [Denitrovibrio sp.]|nr:MAG: hypothetical protein C0602_12825 [Denitrovibrio sp.]
MATVNGVVGQQTITGKTVIDDRHPALVRLKKFKADNGTIPAGEIVALDASGEIVSYDPASGGTEATPVGVCIRETDTAKDTIGSVLVHGAVVAKSLLTKGTASGSNDAAALETATVIWSF